MIKQAMLILLCLTLCQGCADLRARFAAVAGTSTNNEIEQAYQNKEITKAEYLSLKQQSQTNAALRNISKN